ncbi:MAG: hypothetical protein ACTS3F_02480 [Phycisphaerales bacterium]
MMTSTERILRASFVAAVAAAGCLLFIAHRQRADAEQSLMRASADHAAITAQLTEYDQLRARGATALDRPPPADDLIERIRAIARSAASAAPSLRGLEPRNLTLLPPEPIARTGLLRQRVTLTLPSIAPGDLAVFLNEWAASEPLWSVPGLRLTAVDRPDQPITNRFDAQLTLEAVHSRDTTAEPVDPAVPDTGGQP